MQAIETVRFARWLVVSLLLLLCARSAGAQAPNVYRPGDVVSVAFTFEGNVTRFENGGAYLYISDAKMPSGQEGFERQLNCSSGHLSDMHLEVSCKVPPNLATGTYRLGQVSISTGGDAPVIVRYTEGPEFSIRVENPGRIETPILRGIKDVLRH